MAKFEAEDDAHTLARSKAITQDADRLAAAQKAAKSLAKEEEERAKLQKDSSKAMQDLSKGSLSYPGLRKRLKDA